MNRRTFFKAIGIGAASVTLEAGTGIKAELPKELTESPYSNPFDDYIKDPDRIFSNIDMDAGERFLYGSESKKEFTITRDELNVWFYLDTKTIWIHEPMSAQALYSYFKEVWRLHNKLTMREFPMVAITPEQFEVVDGWNIEGLDNLRECGIAHKDDAGKSIEEQAGIIVLTKEGRVFQGTEQAGRGLRNWEVQNNSMVKLTDGKPLGYYFQMSPSAEMIPLEDRILKTLGCNDLTYQCYRIV